MAEDKNRPDQIQGEIVIYQAEDGLTKVECRFVDETVWLTQQQMAHKEALGVQKTYSEAGTSPALKAAATATVPIVQRHLAEVDRMIAA